MNLDFSNMLYSLILRIPAILIAFTFHEYAHAFMADRLGDKTPKFQGRLTLNPLAHIDIIGFIMIMVARFGWAKPVETNPRAYKNYYRDDLKVSLAGPIANLILSLIFTVIVGVYAKFVYITYAQNPVVEILYNILLNVIVINVSLFVFNILPLPGLDGFHVFRDLFPSKFYRVAEQIYRYQMLILIAFIATPLSTYIIGIPSDAIISLLFKVASFIVSI